MISPGATLEIACSIADRIRLNVEKESSWLENMNISITVSLGVAVMTSTHTHEESLINDANSALRRAKEAGRNRVSIMNPPATKHEVL